VKNNTRLELERLVEERTAELVRSNEKLQREIAERTQAEKALRESEERYRTLFEHSLDPIAITTIDGRFVDINDAFVQLVGYAKEEIMNMDSEQLWAVREEWRTWMEQVLQNGAVQDYEWKCLRKDGAVRSCLLNSTAGTTSDASIHCQTICRDITDLKKAQELQIQHIRVKAVADLAIGVAYNFNNLLQVVLGATEVALCQLEAHDHSGAQATLREVVKSCRVASETVKRLESYARIGARDRSSGLEILDLSDIVEYAVDVAKPLWKNGPNREGIEVSLKVQAEPGCLIEAAQDEIFDVVHNLIKNAVEAVPSGGNITVSSRPQGDQVALEVKDTGIGITEENLKRLFNPYFTTKIELGRGLGLPISQRIVEQHRGSIKVDSTKDLGTVVTVLLPSARTDRDG